MLFQSWVDPFIINDGDPGALVGILWMLVLWHHDNVVSLMGAIMSIGSGFRFHPACELANDLRAAMRA